VPITLGAARQPAAERRRTPWHLRLRDAASSYLPLLLMLAVALATWWLAKNSPRPVGPAAGSEARVDPDYTMSGFSLERFDAEGRLKLRLDGAELRHLPATDRIEVRDVRIRAVARDGSVTLARAREAVAKGDGSEIQLLGAAEVTSEDARGAPLVVSSEFLHLFLVTERLVSHLPVSVRHGAQELRAGGLEYGHAAQRLDLKGPVRATLPGRR
jgi:lipopolysaccharide export system protein LptC